MRQLGFLLAAAAALGCAGMRTPYPPLPPNIKKVALRPIVNKTQQASLEDALLGRTRDEFLRNNRYPLVPESEADAVVFVTLTRYFVTPIQYDYHLAPTAYKMRIAAELEMRDKQNPQKILREERKLEGIQIYSSSNLAGGMSEAQAQGDVWDMLARDIVDVVTAGSAPR